VSEYPLRFGLSDHIRSSLSQPRKTVLKSTGFPFFAQEAAIHRTGHGLRS
jgi:hypothetical protein